MLKATQIKYIDKYTNTLHDDLWFMVKYGKKCITEHQTIELAEIRAIASVNPFGWSPSRFLSLLEQVVAHSF